MSEHGFIRKAGRANGPIIRSLRYDGDRLGVALDISHKYQGGKGGKVVKLQLSPYRIDLYKTENGQFKLLRVTHAQIRRQNNGTYAILSEVYLSEKEKRGISDGDKFCFSLYKNDVFEHLNMDGSVLLARLNGQGQGNKIEYKPIDKQETKQLFLTIGRKTKDFIKYSTDVLGNRYRVECETCALILPVL